MINIAAVLLATLSLTSSIFGARAEVIPTNSSLEQRSANACADSSIAVTYIQAFSQTIKAHTLDTRILFVNADTIQDDWAFQGEAFLAWTTPQQFTVPFYRFFTQTNQDYLFTISTDNNPPTVPGFNFDAIVGYVYSSQVCGSIPLLGAWNQQFGDHYYTTDAVDHSALLALSGWVDAGIAAYVLPSSA
ncbi:hypothetical protein BDZ97DRAFT_1799323 [Flammula alnicola]|nr:hypothetical protein BDZ97DRAFT_1799323 [Flammula alnicola]